MEIDFFPRASKRIAHRLEAVGYDSGRGIDSDYSHFGYDYFDNPNLNVGYGGYVYDGRYAEAVERICRHYGLQPGQRILELGCAKGFILVEFTKLGLDVEGMDISEYAHLNADPRVRDKISIGDSTRLPFDDNEFDFVLSKEMLPHVGEPDLSLVIKEAMRVAKGSIFFDIQVGESSKEQALMSRWDSTHKTLRSSEWWRKFLEELNYKGDVNYRSLFPGQ